jgi:hypothetical protein
MAVAALAFEELRASLGLRFSVDAVPHGARIGLRRGGRTGDAEEQHEHSAFTSAVGCRKRAS